MPGTTRWIPIEENPEAEEDVHGALIVRIRENLDFGGAYSFPFVPRVITHNSFCACVYVCMCSS